MVVIGPHRQHSEKQVGKAHHPYHFGSSRSREEEASLKALSALSRMNFLTKRKLDSSPALKDSPVWADKETIAEIAHCDVVTRFLCATFSVCIKVPKGMLSLSR